MLNPGAEQELKLHEEMKLSVLLEGAHFGEMGVLHGGPRNVTVIADTFCMMEMLLGEDFIELLDNFPDIMRHVMKIAREKAEAQALVSTKTIEGHSGNFSIETHQKSQEGKRSTTKAWRQVCEL